MVLEATGNWGRKDLNNLTLRELVELKDEVDDVSDDVNLQIEQAKIDYASTGDSGDTDWFKRASVFKKIMSRKRQLLQEVIAEHKKAARDAHRRSLENSFMKCARSYLPEDDFDRLIELAKIDLGVPI